MIIAVNLGGSVLSLACCFAGATLITPVVYTIAWVKSEESVAIRPSAVSRALIKDFVSYSASLGLIALSWILVSGLSLPIVSIYAFDDVAPYSLATIYGNMLLIPQGAILMTMLPTLSTRSLENDPAGIGHLLLRFARVASLPLATLTAGLLICSPPFLRLWAGPALAPQVLTPAALLVFAAFVSLTTQPYRLAALGAGQQMATVPATLIEGTISVGLSVLLGRWLGGTGVALAVLIAAICGLVAQLFISIPRTPAIRVSRKAYLATALVRPALAALPATVLLVFLAHNDISLVAWLPIITIASGLAALAVVTIGFDKSDRQEALAMVSARLRPLSKKYFNKS